MNRFSKRFQFFKIWIIMRDLKWLMLSKNINLMLVKSLLSRVKRETNFTFSSMERQKLP